MGRHDAIHLPNMPDPRRNGEDAKVDRPQEDKFNATDDVPDGRRDCAEEPMEDGSDGVAKAHGDPDDAEKDHFDNPGDSFEEHAHNCVVYRRNEVA